MKIKILSKSDFPNVPDEVYKMFIEPLNTNEENIFDSQPEGRWHYHFGGISIDEFSKLRWSRTKIFLNVSILHPDSYFDINGLIRYCGKNHRAPFVRYPEDSPERLIWHKEFVLKTSRLCAPVVGINTMGFIRILDGTHRLAAIFSIGFQNNTPVDIWLGERPDI